MKGEQKYEEMVQILDHLHQYVPTVTSEELVNLPDGGQEVAMNDAFHKIEIGKLY